MNMLTRTFKPRIHSLKTSLAYYAPCRPLVTAQCHLLEAVGEIKSKKIVSCNIIYAICSLGYTDAEIDELTAVLQSKKCAWGKIDKIAGVKKK